SAANGQPAPGSGNGRQSAEATDEGERIKASPLARKLAESAQIDLGRVRGSGPNGRIVRRDVEEYIQSQPVAAQAAAAQTPPARSAAPPAPSAAPAPMGAQRIPHSRMRKTIAQRMVQAKQAASEIHLTVDIRVDRVVTAREELNKRLAREGIKLSM